MDDQIAQHTQLDAKGLLAASSWTGKTFVGQWADSNAGTLNVTEPATGKLLGVVGAGSPAAITSAVGLAKKAQRDWAATETEERARVLRKAAALFEENIDVLADWIIRETGGLRGKAETELKGTIGELYHSAALLIEPQGHVLSSQNSARLSLARRVPVGIVGVITPWNFPMLLAMRSVAPALALGNAVVLKPDIQTPITGGVVLARIFEAAGIPSGVFSVVNGGADVGEALVTAPGVRLITFTGSTAVGKRVGELASRSLKKVSLELGGKSPFIIMDDADIDAAASAGAWGSFLHQGQICMASGRHIVHRKVADAYIEALAKRAAHLPVGDPFRQQVAIGPIINARQVARVHGIVTDTIAAGAQLAAGGTFEGPFYSPTVLTGVTQGMPAYDQEIFGPVAPVIIAEDEAHAIELANDTDYGLSAAIYTASFERGLRIASEIHSGMIHINDQTISDLPGIPMGGMGASGNGSRFGSTTNWDEFTEWQWMTIGATPVRYPF